MPRLLAKFHTGEFWRGAAFPIGKVGKHPVEIVEDIDKVFLSILQILNTRRGERVMYPEFGSDLGPILWEPHDVFLQQEIRKELTRALGLWEPRVFIENITFNTNAFLRNVGILIVSLTIRLVNNPRLDHVIQVPISSQGRLFSQG
jgi:phage baseplate assembly protein W